MAIRANSTLFKRQNLSRQILFNQDADYLSAQFHIHIPSDNHLTPYTLITSLWRLRETNLDNDSFVILLIYSGEF